MSLLTRIKWSKELIIEEIKKIDLVNLNSTSVKASNPKLFRAAQRHFGSWGAAIAAAGFDYEKIVKWGPRTAYNKGKGGTCTFPGCSNIHHANGMCRRHDAMFRYRKDKGTK
ncbi:hypothetical protein HN747_05055 [archaeon]|jgi:hypothetical protein|nr:hypothetical protein [archaeon]